MRLEVAEFLGDLAFMFEVFVLGLGLVTLHFSKKENSNLLKWAGRLMSTFAALGIICTGYFYMKYFFAGDFDHIHHMRKSRNQMEMNMMHSNRQPKHLMMTPQMMENDKKQMLTKMNQCVDQIQGKMMNEENNLMLKNCFLNSLKEN